MLFGDIVIFIFHILGFTFFFFFFQAEDGIRDLIVTGVQTCALPIFVVTHAILILGTMASRSHEIPSVLREIHVGFAQGLRPPPLGLGLAGMLALFMQIGRASCRERV